MWKAVKTISKKIPDFLLLSDRKDYIYNKNSNIVNLSNLNASTISNKLIKYSFELLNNTFLPYLEDIEYSCKILSITESTLENNESNLIKNSFFTEEYFLNTNIPNTVYLYTDTLVNKYFTLEVTIDSPKRIENIKKFINNEYLTQIVYSNNLISIEDLNKINYTQAIKLIFDIPVENEVLLIYKVIKQHYFCYELDITSDDLFDVLYIKYGFNIFNKIYSLSQLNNFNFLISDSNIYLLKNA